MGEIQTRSYEAKDGTKRYVTEVVADEVEFLSPRVGVADHAPVDLEGFTDVDDDSELPF